MRHFIDRDPGIRLLMADELDFIAGGNGSDSDDVVSEGNVYSDYANGSNHQVQGNIDNMDEMIAVASTRSGQIHFSGPLTGWNFDSSTNTSTCTFTDPNWGHSWTVTYQGDYCPDGYINY